MFDMAVIATAIHLAIVTKRGDPSCTRALWFTTIYYDTIVDS